MLSWFLVHGIFLLQIPVSQSIDQLMKGTQILDYLIEQIVMQLFVSYFFLLLHLGLH